MNAKDYFQAIEQGKKDRELTLLYDPESLGFQRKRYASLCKKIESASMGADISIYSAPGRTELGGNHTDHNLGRVLAGSLTLDTVGTAYKTDSRTIEVESEGFDKRFIVGLDDLAPKKEETGRPESIIRGIASRFSKKGYNIGGFTACASSTVPLGGGLSSSASFEVLVATIFSSLYNGAAIPAVEIALACQHAENHFFGKPCGLMDQLSSALGGVVAIDFANPENPKIEKIEVDLGEYGLSLVILGTGGHHADLTHEYAAIPEEMKAVARALGKTHLGEADPSIFINVLPTIRESVGDRALLRALHFFGDTSRVQQQVSALSKKNIGEYLALVNESGNSSWKLLQNCYPSAYPKSQGICLALALTERFLAGGGASRVHGSGFGGAIQAYIPVGKLSAYKELMEPVFGRGCMIPLSIRKTGADSVL